MIMIYNSTDITDNYPYQEIFRLRISPRAFARMSDTLYGSRLDG